VYLPIEGSLAAKRLEPGRPATWT